jgi:hypothetical protein
MVGILPDEERDQGWEVARLDGQSPAKRRRVDRMREDACDRGFPFLSAQ